MGILRIVLRALFSQPKGSRRRPFPAPVPQASDRVIPLPGKQANLAPPAAPHLRFPSGHVIEGACWVVDGDTVVVAGVYIRLAGIDAPELDHPYGQSAKWALIRICRGQRIRVELLQESSHDRCVGRCYLPDGRDLAAEMVRAGHAVDWPKYSGGRYTPLEVPGVRSRLWRCDARQKGRFPPQREARSARF